jgi:hypothetical protein
MAYVIHDPDNIVVARKGALHEQLTKLVAQVQTEIKDGTNDLVNIDPAYLAYNILERMLHSGDGRIHDSALTR